MTLRPAGFALALTFAFSLFLFSAPASAMIRPRGVRVRLDYERGAGAQPCPSEKALRGAVAVELGDDPFTEAGSWKLHVSVVRRKNGAFAARAEFFDSDGAPWLTMDEMVEASCQKLLLHSVALWISIELTDPPPPCPELPPPPPPLSPSPSSLPPPTLTCAEPLRSAPSVELPPAFRLRLGAAAGAEIGVGPHPTPLLVLNLGLQSTRTTPILSLAFELRADLPLTSTAEGSALIVSGALVPCLHVIKEGLLFVCPMLTAGVPVLGHRSEDASVSGIYSAAGGRIGGAIPFASHRFAVTLAVDALATLHPLRWRFNEQILWKTSSVTVALQAGASAFF